MITKHYSNYDSFGFQPQTKWSLIQWELQKPQTTTMQKEIPGSYQPAKTGGQNCASLKRTAGDNLGIPNFTSINQERMAFHVVSRFLF